MNAHSFRRLAATTTLLVLAGSITSQALATDPITEVTVSADRITRLPESRTNSGFPMEVITLTRQVSYADLDLVSASGAAMLQTRVKETARAACDQLDKTYPLTRMDNSNCNKMTTDAALIQARAAISAAAARKLTTP